MNRLPDVLLIEDNEDDIAVARWALAKHNLSEHVAVVHDGQEALDVLSSRPAGQTRLVLLDLKMPRMDGREVLRRLRADERTRTMPVVVISTSQRHADIEESYRLGANSYVCKRYGPSAAGDHLIEVLRYWLDVNRLPPPPGGGTP
ncbi:MAG TPA: response regulator [Planctomycetota bacterium]|nr:response regulator [Planctomycetota bacterium]